MNHPFHIALPSTDLDVALQNKIDQKTKPLGSLGELEKVAFQLGRIQQTLDPVIKQPSMIVFAADHGIVAQKVSLFPQEVTQQMVGNFLAGGAAVSVFCQQHAASLRIVDVGVKGNIADQYLSFDAFSDRKIAEGTEDFSQQAAMTKAQYMSALQAGVDEVEQVYLAGSNLLLLGEMGIGNTTTAACLMSCLTGFSADDCVGPGTGLAEQGIQHKAAVIDLVKQRIREKHGTDAEQLPVDLLVQECGGYEIVAMAGAMLQAAERSMSFVVDGFICSVAFLVAQKLNENVSAFAIFAHESQETAHRRLLNYLGAVPLLSMKLRLGEGSGAILALPLIQSATIFMKEMASFESASVSSNEKN